MGASAREIERQIKETRARMDDNITSLEDRAVSSVRRHRVVSAGLAGAVLLAGLAGVAFLIYRRMHRPTLRERLDDLSVDDLRHLTRRLKDQMPSVTVRVNEKALQQPGTVESIVRKAAPALVGTAGTALIERIAVRPEAEYAPRKGE